MEHDVPIQGACSNTILCSHTNHVGCACMADVDALLGSLSDDESSPVRPFPPFQELSPGSCGSCWQSDDGDDDDDVDGDNDEGSSSDSSSSPELDFGPSAAASSSNGPSATPASARERAYQRGKDVAKGSKAPTSQGCASCSVASARGGRPTQAVLDERRKNSVNDALQGQDAKGKRHTLKTCTHSVQIGGNQCPCHANLWVTHDGSTGKDELEEHMRKWLGYSEAARRRELVAQLRESYCPDTGQWCFLVHGRPVCRSVFLLFYPISSGQLTKIQNSLASEGDHDSGNECAAEPRLKEAKRAVAVAGWLLGFCEEIGDRVGCLLEGSNAETLIIPRMEKHMVWLEYKESEGEDACSESYFMHIWRNDPDLQHIEMARKIRNFQLCTTCHTNSEGITSAHKSHNSERLEFWRRKRRDHHGLQRGERMSYYKRRRAAASDLDGQEYLSLILDKWDSAKTTVPFWAREPSFLGPQDKHQMLQQHVLGVIIHGQPHAYYLYTFNDNLKGDANMNIEGIRRTLLKHLAGGKPMPRILFIQADNASDNKNFAMIGFLAALVLHGYCHEIHLSFLLVGHTHEDIDQFFSVLTRHVAKLGVVKTPQAFQAEIQKAAAGKGRKVDASMVHAVPDWTNWLKPFANQTIAGIQRATFTEAVSEKREEDIKEVRSPHVFRFTRRADGAVVMHYKEYSVHEVWLPPLNPNAPACQWMTDPKGIEMFAAGMSPPDPVSMPKSLAPYVT